MNDVFCDDCRRASTKDNPGNLSAFNGIGRKLYGGADECAKCGSVVKTLWFVVLFLPVVPLGSYRFKIQQAGAFRSSFFARKTATHWPQIVRTWLVGWALGVVGFLVLWNMKHK